MGTAGSVYGYERNRPMSDKIFFTLFLNLDPPSSQSGGQGGKKRELCSGLLAAASALYLLSQSAPAGAFTRQVLTERSMFLCGSRWVQVVD